MDTAERNITRKLNTFNLERHANAKLARKKLFSATTEGINLFSVNILKNVRFHY